MPARSLLLSLCIVCGVLFNALPLAHAEGEEEAPPTEAQDAEALMASIRQTAKDFGAEDPAASQAAQDAAAAEASAEATPEPAQPPAEEAQPPAEENPSAQPPAEETQPPVEEAQPPAEEAQPPAEEHAEPPPAAEVPPESTPQEQTEPPVAEPTPAPPQEEPPAEPAPAPVEALSPELADENEACPSWAAAGECTKNPKYMSKTCAKSCANVESSETCTPEDHEAGKCVMAAAPTPAEAAQPNEEHSKEIDELKALLEETSSKLVEEQKAKKRLESERKEFQNKYEKEKKEAVAAEDKRYSAVIDLEALKSKLRTAEDSHASEVQKLKEQIGQAGSGTDTVNPDCTKELEEAKRGSKELELDAAKVPQLERKARTAQKEVKELQEELQRLKGSPKGEEGKSSFAIALYSVLRIVGEMMHSAGAELIGKITGLEPPLNIIAIIFSTFMFLLVTLRGSGRSGPATVVMAAPSGPASVAASVPAELTDTVNKLQFQINDLKRHVEHQSNTSAQGIGQLAMQLNSFQNERNAMDEEMVLSTKEILMWLATGENGSTTNGIDGLTTKPSIQAISTPADMAPKSLAPALSLAPLSPEVPKAAPEVAPAPEAAPAPAPAAAPAPAPMPAPAPAVEEKAQPSTNAFGAAAPTSSPSRSQSKEPQLEAAAPPSTLAGAFGGPSVTPAANNVAHEPAPTPEASPFAATSSQSETPAAPAPPIFSGAPQAQPSAFGIVPPGGNMGGAPRSFPPVAAAMPTPPGSRTASKDAALPSSEGQAAAEPPKEQLGGIPPAASASPSASEPPSAGPPTSGPPPSTPPAAGPPAAGPPAAGPPLGGPPAGGPPLGGGRPQQQEIQAASNPFGSRPKQQPIQAAASPFGRPQPKAIVAASSPFG